MWAWIKNLAAALVGGAIAGATSYTTSGGTVDLKKLGGAALAGAVSTGIAYAMQSPHGAPTTK